MPARSARSSGKPKFSTADAEPAEASATGVDFEVSASPRGSFTGRRHNRPDASAPRPRRGLTWSLRGLLVASLAVPLLLLAIAAWQNLRFVWAQAREHVASETDELHLHAVNAFETFSLALDLMDDRVRGLDWDQIEHDPELHQFLSDIEKLPEIDVVWITDPTGHDRASGRFLSLTPADVSDRDYFVAEKARDIGIFIGRAHIGRRTGRDEFSISRRRSAADGRFDGIVRIAAKPSYFSDFYSTREKRVSALLLRSDGAVLARYPASSSPFIFSMDSGFMNTIAVDPARGVFSDTAELDGVQRLYGYRRVGDYPIYVVFGIPTRGVIALWRDNLASYSLVAVPASLALFAMTLIAVRQSQRHKIGSWRWQITALRLKREMDRRAIAEAELRQAQKMEALGQLTGGVAHDFNNLLTVLQGCLELLSGRQRDDPSQARVDTALRTIARGETLTRQLLAFAQRRPQAVASLDLNARLRGMAEMLARTVGSEIKIETDLAPDLWPIDADANQFELAVINLAINGRDAMPGGGVLRLKTYNAPRSAETADMTLPQGEFVALEVSDTGMGMAPEVLSRAFEPFFTTKPAGKGTGLGLSLVYDFARQSGGTAAIRSKPGHGTKVTLRLPRSRKVGDPKNNRASGLLVGGPA
jgi:two-component system, NtrC family, sensor kinase